LVNWKDVKDFFVGNPNTYAIQKPNGTWTVIKERLLRNIIEKHLSQELTIGSYYIYKRHNRICCKWICLDLDLHALELENDIIINNSSQLKDIKLPIRLKDSKKNWINTKKDLEKIYWSKSGIIIKEEIKKADLDQYKRESISELYLNDDSILYFIEKERIEANEFEKLDKFSLVIKDFLSQYYQIPAGAICRERSGRGYHVWIKLENETTLLRAFDFREDVKEKISQFFGMECEIFPKQLSIEGLVKGLGNFVKVPLSINRKNNVFCEILDNFDLSQQSEGFKITDLISKIRKSKRKEQRFSFKQSQFDLSKWKPLENMEDHTFFEKLRPCLYEIVKGVYGDHWIRMQVANELFKLKTPLSTRINAFRRQADFDEYISEYQCKDLEIRAKKNNRFFVASCKSIAQHGWCLPNCPFKKTEKKIEISKKQLDLLLGKKEFEGITGGFEAVRQLFGEEMEDETRSDKYIVKTTRSGATTSMIYVAIEKGYKILVLAPTIKICEITVQEAINRSSKDPKLFRFGSNKDLCKILQDKVKRIPQLNLYPFLLKENCKYCKINDCGWRIALNEIQNFDIIYITIAKLYALMKSKNTEAKKILNNIFKTVNIIFLDEVSNILDIGAQGIKFIAIPDPIYKSMSPEIIFPRRFKYEYELVREYIEKKLTKQQKKIWFALMDFVKITYKIHKQWRDLHINNSFQCLTSPLYKVIRENDEYYKERNKRRSGDTDWIDIYQALMNYTEENDFFPKCIIDILLLAKHPQFYLQYTNPMRYKYVLELFPAKPIKEFLEFVNKISKKKKFFTTDATEPPIDIKRIFPNIDLLIINDPNGTAKLQTVIPYKKPINLSRPSYLQGHLDEIYEFIDKYGNNNTMIITQSIYMSALLRKILDKGKHYHTLTYFRSPLTQGTPSKCRRVITIGSPYPPKNSHRWLADLFIKQKIVNDGYNIENLTQRLELYNAKSAYFQAISRGKDPEGIIPSYVYSYGLNRTQIYKLLDFPIAVPKVI